MFSDYIVYVDESGDHSLTSIDANYPMFVLACCIIRKDEYQTAVNDLLQFKFDTFGHDTVVFHDREIRKALGPFGFLTDEEKRSAFYTRLHTFIGKSPFTLVAAAIHKQNLNKQYLYPDNPYELALTFCLERSYAFLKDHHQIDNPTYVVVESRGKKEDAELNLVFRRVCEGTNMWAAKFPFRMACCSKLANSTGLQLADLVARHIGQHVLHPTTPSRAWDVIVPKLRSAPWGVVRGWGLKVFP